MDLKLAPPRNQANPETQAGRGAWVTLGLALLLLAAGVLVLAYRFTLPTDGWKAELNGETDDYTYVENQMGGLSGLRPGDVVVAVAGISVNDWEALPRLAPGWQKGATLTYTVLRAGREWPVDVTLVGWRIGAWLRSLLRDPGELAKLSSSYLLLAISALVFWRRPGNPAAGAFFLLNAVLITSELHTGTLPFALPESIDLRARSMTGPGANAILYGVLMPSALLRFALVFPRPLRVLQRMPWLAHVPVAASLLVLVASPAGSIGGWLWFLLSLVLMVAILAYKAITMRDAVSRAQIMWGLGGLIFGFGSLALLLVASTFGTFGGGSGEDLFDLAGAAAFTVMGVTLGIAITRYRLFDIDVIIRRTLVYSVLTALLALTYFGSILILQSVLRGLTGGESPLVIVLSTLLIAALAAPLRQRVQQVIDRRFFRRKYDAARTLAAFGAQARDETDLGRLSDRLTGVVQETMQPAHVDLWVRDKP